MGASHTACIRSTCLCKSASLDRGQLEGPHAKTLLSDSLSAPFVPRVQTSRCDGKRWILAGLHRMRHESDEAWACETILLLRAEGSLDVDI